ncbi:hypothetical protein PALB_5040 [Pseudoalteromonas luteoviolacea B = ATCC 29581]|nr:hypothetical protein PALB_5040 [Pseudoalteromonas luteoviolacea B = ATCC 29581]
MSPELSVILLNLSALIICYGFINPRFSGSNFNKICFQDALASLVVFSIVGSIYYGKGVTFSLVIFEVNWFWFTLITYGAIELLCFMIYKKRYGIDMP